MWAKQDISEGRLSLLVYDCDLKRNLLQASGEWGPPPPSPAFLPPGAGQTPSLQALTPAFLCGCPAHSFKGQTL